MTQKSYKELMVGVLPYLAVNNCAEAIAFYERALGAKVRGETARAEDGRILNVTLEIAGGAIMLSDHFPEHGGVVADGGPMPLRLQMISNDGDAVWKRAIDAGFTELGPFTMQFWGDKYGHMRCPYGFHWALLEPSAESEEKSKGF